MNARSGCDVGSNGAPAIPNPAPCAVESRSLRAWARRWEVARWGRLLAGLATLSFTLMGVLVHSAWLLGTLGVALQLVVSALTDRCPLRNTLLRLGLREREDLFIPGGARRET